MVNLMVILLRIIYCITIMKLIIILLNDSIEIIIEFFFFYIIILMNKMIKVKADFSGGLDLVFDGKSEINL